jgi:hypothetical protein
MDDFFRHHRHKGRAEIATLCGFLIPIIPGHSPLWFLAVCFCKESPKESTVSQCWRSQKRNSEKLE